MKIEQILKSNSYPGRGIVIGQTADGKYGVVSYFIMGRSENSRNRVFVSGPDMGQLRTKAYDESKLSDPSLIIYSPVRVLDGKDIIVTNGDQTDTVFELLQKGKTFEDALRTRTFEPDAPNFTPRISGITYNNFGGYVLSILKVAGKQFFDYEGQAGAGHFIHTYQSDGDPLPSFAGEPVEVEIPESPVEFTNTVWGNLNADNKVSLFTRYVDLSTGETTDIIHNKHEN
jgi:Archaeal IMP cyclohydrolase